MDRAHQQPPSSSQASSSSSSSRVTLEPISAAVLAAQETKRRDALRWLGPYRSGCRGLDEYVLLGGLERGHVVGVSAEEEDDVGVLVSFLGAPRARKKMHCAASAEENMGYAWLTVPPWDG